jgi:tetratricopeptide (TPR) repeat protein
VREGIEAIYRLDYAAARRVFESLKEERPADPVAYGMLSVLTWDELLLAAGNLAMDDYATPMPFTKRATTRPIEAETRRLHEAVDALIRVCDAILAKSPDDTAALYFKGVAFENLAAEAVVISKKGMRGMDYGKQARRLHERVLDLDPSFIDAQVSIASSEFARANLPWKIRWFTFLIGISGSQKKAFERLRAVADRGKYRHLDAEVLLALLKTWKGSGQEAEEAARTFEELREKYPQNYLLDINLAAMYEQPKLNRPKAALRVYEELLKNLHRKGAGIQAGEVHFRMGKALSRLHEYSRALGSFRQALASSRRERETEALALFQMAQIHEAQGAPSEALGCYRNLLKSSAVPGVQKETAHARRKLGLREQGRPAAVKE